MGVEYQIGIFKFTEADHALLIGTTLIIVGMSLIVYVALFVNKPAAADRGQEVKFADEDETCKDPIRSLVATSLPSINFYTIHLNLHGKTSYFNLIQLICPHLAKSRDRLLQRKPDPKHPPRDQRPPRNLPPLRMAPPPREALRQRAALLQKVELRRRK